MSHDDLRTRIADVIYDNGDYDYQHCRKVADAVIRELGLRVEYGMGDQHDYSDNPEIHPVSKDEMDRRMWYGEDWTYRYVTEWGN